MGMMWCESDWSVHHRTAGGKRTITTTSVDDILAASSLKSESDKFTQQLQQLYALTDNNDVKWILGCQVTRWHSLHCLKLDQEWYTTAILKQFNMEHCNAATVLMLSRLNSNDCTKTENKIMVMRHIPYCELVHKLMYLATCTCPDITFTVWELAKFMSNYGPTHWKAAKHLLQYLQGTRSYGIYYGHINNPFPIFRGLSDSDWAQGEGQKSVGGHLIMMGGRAIGYSSQQQGVVALSSCEAEYIACADMAKNILWFQSLASELGYAQCLPTTLLCDNQGMITSTHNPQNHSHMKHIDIHYHFI